MDPEPVIEPVVEEVIVEDQVQYTNIIYLGPEPITEPGVEEVVVEDQELINANTIYLTLNPNPGGF